MIAFGKQLSSLTQNMTTSKLDITEHVEHVEQDQAGCCSSGTKIRHNSPHLLLVHIPCILLSKSGMDYSNFFISFFFFFFFLGGGGGI